MRSTALRARQESGGAPGSGLTSLPKGSSPAARPGIVLDVMGIALVLVMIIWARYVRYVRVVPADVFELLIGCTLLLALSRMVGHFWRWLVPLAVIAVAAGFVITNAGVFDARPDEGLFGYTNARAAFFVQSAAAAAVLIAAWHGLLTRILALGAVILLGAVPFFTGTHAGMIAVAGLVAVMAVGSERWARVAVALAGSAFVVTIALSGFLAARYEGAGSSGILERIVERTPLHEHRVELWHEALEIMIEHPVTGVGPGRFAEVSALAQKDVDSRYARNEFLQFGAETGVVGLALLVLLFLWGFTRLLLTPSPDRITAIAAVALAALGMHASVDYVLHFPAVPLAAAALVGTGIAAGHRKEPG
jgi:O-antigen ligase